MIMRRRFLVRVGVCAVALIGLHQPLSAGDYSLVALPEMVKVPGGSYIYGSAPDAAPPGPSDFLPVFGSWVATEEHASVAVFEMSATEITVEHWNQCVRARQCVKLKGSGHSHPRQPATGMSYFEALDYVSWLNNVVPGGQFSLPTERQWEYAAKAGKSQDFWLLQRPTSEEEVIGPRSSPTYNGAARPNVLSPAGSRSPNPFGLSDMLGSVMEWTSDCFDNPHMARRSKGALSTSETERCLYCVVRGANYQMSSDYARPTARTPITCNQKSSFIGFRVVKQET